MELEIVNVVSTADLKQSVNLNEISKLGHVIFDQEIYGGRVAYLKKPEMHGKVTIFSSGKLISVGTKSPEQAEDDLMTTHDTLVDSNIITPTEITTTLRNIVAVLRLPNQIDLEIIASHQNVIYEPEQFPAAIMKSTDPKVTYLIFGSGKIVILGTKSLRELQEASQKITNILKNINRITQDSPE